MMNIVLLIVLFLVFGLLNFYVFIRGVQALPAGFKIPYAILFWAVVFSFLGGRWLENSYPSLAADVLTWIGSFWIAALVYLLLAVLLLDILRLANRFLPFFPDIITGNYARAKIITAGVILGAVGLTLLGGYINARNPRIVHLDIAVDKKAGSLQNLNIVMVSDIHLGTIIGRSRIESLVNDINALNPDIVLIPGDLVDGSVKAVLRNDSGEELKNIRSRYGVFASMGNHEYIGGSEEICEYLERNNIMMLRDQSVKIDKAFFLVGREDLSSRRAGRPRKALSNLMRNVDPKFPVILLDHQPSDLQEAADAGIDLQLSGHTHYGQIWPINYIVEAIYELAWGYKRAGGTQYYVSNGVGTWGPPVRVGNRPEIVQIQLTFK